MSISKKVVSAFHKLFKTLSPGGTQAMSLSVKPTINIHNGKCSHLAVEDSGTVFSAATKIDVKDLKKSQFTWDVDERPVENNGHRVPFRLTSTTPPDKDQKRDIDPGTLTITVTNGSTVTSTTLDVDYVDDDEGDDDDDDDNDDDET
jgi:hypothetical protein